MKTLILSILFSISSTHAARFVVESHKVLTAAEMSNKSFTIKRFAQVNDAYFSRLYVVSGNVSQAQVENLAWAKRVEQGFELSRLSLLPSDKPDMVVDEELFPYQWSLLNQGQTYNREKDDIHNLPVNGVTGKDIKFKKLFAKLGDARPVIAVLDSGIDLNHPDIKENLWKNVAECGKDSSQDNDKNKLKGDCDGWNFTEDMESEAAKKPNDIDGHGTHVAGIIAASINGSGIVGVNPNALIMPIKVMRDSNSESDIPSSEAFALGLLYAADMGADVINMSLGWPRALETETLRRAVAYAMNKGVIIVAAAGNNNSSEPLFPCAYEGVICVAASTLDGSFANFSNFGGHVDTIAPGEGILSLHPTFKEPDFFSVTGYEVRSGTSQAAPLVAGMIATLKAQDKTLSLDNIMARIYSAPLTNDESKYTVGGESNWESLSQDVSTSVVRPLFKRLNQITLNGELQNTDLTLSVKNYGQNSGSISVKVETLSQAIKVTSSDVNFSGIATGEVKEVHFDLSILNLNGESSVKLKVTISDVSGSRVYFKELPVARNISDDSDFKKLPFQFVDKALPVAGFSRTGAVMTTLSQVEGLETSNQLEFFMRKTVREENKRQVEITLFSRENNKFVQAKDLFIVPNAVLLVAFKRLDLNADGTEDYMVNSLVREDDKISVVFSFFKKDASALWPSFQHVKLELNIYLDSVVTLLRDQLPLKLNFLPYTDSKLGKMMVPAFNTSGQLPRIDQVLTSWDRADAGRKNRLYYLQPSEGKFQARALNTNVWEAQLKKELNTRWMDNVDLERVLPLSSQDVKNGKIRAIVSVGFGTKRDIFVYAFDTKSSSHGAKLPQLVIQTDKVDGLFKVGTSGLERVGEVYFNVYDRTRAKIIMTKAQAQESQYIYRHDSGTDVIMGHLASFEKDNGKFSVMESREELISVTSGQTNKISKRAKIRYSFLSQRLLTEMYLPVTYNRQGSIRPGFYVDSTAITGNRINVLEEQQGNLVASIRNSILVPNRCKALSPNYSVNNQAYEFIFICQEGNSWMIKTLGMK